MTLIRQTYTTHKGI